MDYEPLAVMGVGLLLGSVIRVRGASVVKLFDQLVRAASLDPQYHDDVLVCAGCDRFWEQHCSAVGMGPEPCCRN